MKTRTYHIREYLYTVPGFGLSKDNMGKLKTIVTIGDKSKKTGELLYPHKYVIKTKDAVQFKTMWAGSKQVYKIPFSACKIIQGD